MGFYGGVPFTKAEAFFINGEADHGAFLVLVDGDAKNFTYGIVLVRDTHFVGGLKIDVMGWTGPLGAGTTPYHVHGVFPGGYVPKIVVGGAGHSKLVDVKRISEEDAHALLKGAVPA